MTIPEQQTRYVYAGPYAVGDTAPIPFDYAETFHVKVTQGTTLLRFNVDYTVLGKNVTFKKAIPAGNKVVVYRDTTLDNEAEFPQEAVFDSDKINDALDKLTMQNQEQDDALGLCIKLPIDAPESVDMTFPEPEANRCIKWAYDGAKYTLVNSTTDPDDKSGGGGGGGGYTKAETDALLNKKQNKLTAGSNITIIGDVISSTGGGGSGTDEVAREMATEAKATANTAKDIAEAAYASTTFTTNLPLVLDKTGDVASVGWNIDADGVTATATAQGMGGASAYRPLTRLYSQSGLSSDGKAFKPVNALYFPMKSRMYFRTSQSYGCFVAGVLRSNGYFEPRFIFPDGPGSGSGSDYRDPKAGQIHKVTSLSGSTEVVVTTTSVGTWQSGSSRSATSTQKTNFASQLDCSGSGVVLTNLRSMNSADGWWAYMSRCLLDTANSDLMKECNVLALFSAGTSASITQTTWLNIFDSSVDEAWAPYYNNEEKADELLASLTHAHIPTGTPVAGLSLLYNEGTLAVNSQGELYVIGAGAFGFPNYENTLSYENNTEYQVAENGWLMWNSAESTDDGETTLTITQGSTQRTFVTKSSSEDRDDTRMAGTYPLSAGTKFKIVSQDRGSLVPVNIYFFPSFGEQA